MELGTALAEVRDRRLYLQTHSTFEDYCAQRWQLSRPRAYDELMHAAEVAAAMSAMADTPAVVNERQARVLAPVVRDHGPEVAARVLAAAAESRGTRVGGWRCPGRNARSWWPSWTSRA